MVFINALDRLHIFPLRFTVEVLDKLIIRGVVLLGWFLSLLELFIFIVQVKAQDHALAEWLNLDVRPMIMLGLSSFEASRAIKSFGTRVIWAFREHADVLDFLAPLTMYALLGLGLLEPFGFITYLRRLIYIPFQVELVDLVLELILLWLRVIHYFIIYYTILLSVQHE